MASHRGAFESLIAEHARLKAEIAKIDQQIVDAVVILGKGVGRGGVGKSPAGSASRRKRRHWFERGEASKLLQRQLRGPRRPSELVHATIAAKGYTRKSLGDEDFKRLEVTVYQAIYQALRAKVLAKNSAGLLVKA